MTRPAQLLQDHFGFSTFRPGQEAVIEHLLAGRSAAAVFPTGSGKSLCYQLPALVMDGVTLVVSPLLALMKDQIDRLQRQGIAADRLDSTQTAAEAAAVTSRLRRGELKMLYVAPERFNNERFRALIRDVPVALMTVDEAHCISEWGHAFRPDYLKLARYAKQCGARRTLALTATATPAVLADICRVLDIAPACAVRTGFYRENLLLLTTPVEAGERDGLLLKRLRERERGPAIVYVTQQKTAEEVAARLVAGGLPATFYHAGMESEDRTRVQERFETDDDAIIVATIAFGMGIDRANIRGVYHYNLAKSLEGYSQEIGRAGRDGAPARCEMLVCRDDLPLLEDFARGDTPTLAAVRGVVGTVFDHGDEIAVSSYATAKKHGLKALVLSTLLTYLELEGLIESGTPFYARYAVRPIAALDAILGRFEGERRDFLASVFAEGAAGRIWHRFDLDAVAATLGQPRDRLVRAFGYLADQGLAEVKTESVQSRYRILRRPPDADALARALHQRMVEREAQELARLRQVLAMAELDGCRSYHLARHFGEEREGRCGHCSGCLRS